MTDSSRRGGSVDDTLDGTLDDTLDDTLDGMRTALPGPVRRTRRPKAPRPAELSVCRACKHATSRGDEPWDNGWRCLGGCTRCLTMIGCVPTPGAELI